MNVTFDPKMTFTQRIAVKKVSIELDDMEAGWLRSLLRKQPPRGFAEDLRKELLKYRFPAHEERYGTPEEIAEQDQEQG